MIHIVDDYYIDVDSLQYIMGKAKEYTDKKTGKTSLRINSPKYYTTLQSAILGLLDSLKRDKLINYSGELKEAVASLKQAESQFQEFLEKAMQGM